MGAQKGVSTLLWVGAWGLLLTMQGAALQEPASVQPEEVLKGRVEQFYTLLLGSQMADAEAYVSREAVENFRRLRNNSFVGFHVETVLLDAEGTRAEVETTILSMFAQAPQPLPFRRKSNWRLEDGEWRLFLPIGARRNMADVHMPGKPVPPTTKAPADLQFDSDGVNLGIIYKDQKSQVRFSFANISDHPVHLQVETGCECLRATKDDKMYGPGESGEVTIEFDPAGYAFLYKQSVVVKTEPGGRNHLLLIEAQVPPAESRPAQ